MSNSKTASAEILPDSRVGNHRFPRRSDSGPVRIPPSRLKQDESSGGKLIPSPVIGWFDGRVLDAQLLEIGVEPARVVVKRLQRFTIRLHDLLVEVSGSTVRGTDKGGIRRLAGLDGLEVIPRVVHECRPRQKVYDSP